MVKIGLQYQALYMMAKGCHIVGKYICSAKRNVTHCYVSLTLRSMFIILLESDMYVNNAKGEHCFFFISYNGYAKGPQGYKITYISYPFTIWTRRIYSYEGAACL